MSIFESRDAKNDGPASSITTFAPAFVSAYAAMPPPAPEPTIQTSYTKRLLVDCQCVFAALIAHRREIPIARLHRREGIGEIRRVIALDEGVGDVRAVRGVVGEDLREVDRAAADVRHLALGRGGRVLHVHERKASREALEVVDRIGAALH